MSLITLRQAAVRFDLSYDSLRRIAAAGLLPEVGHHGDKPVISTDVAQRIQARSAVALDHLLPTTTGTATMAVLRVDAAKPVPNEDRPGRHSPGDARRLRRRSTDGAQRLGHQSDRKRPDPSPL
ncbi:hypothetical protein ABZW49_05030 [Nonomuraea wenchangensis]